MDDDSAAKPVGVRRGRVGSRSEINLREGWIASNTILNTSSSFNIIIYLFIFIMVFLFIIYSHD